ncbi:MAG: hypothetical protein IPP35_11905 [Elusimicrobia bacterium]|nr:hypothetical protein [Elusimicrobiota bacterium]
MTRMIAVGTALPRLRVSQKDALRFILKNFDLRARTRAFYRRVFSHHSVATRHFAVRKLEDILDRDLDRKNARFEREALRLSTLSLKRVLSLARRVPSQVDFLAAATCTGYLCPGLAARVVDAAGLRHDVPFADLVGMGCGAALPALQAANSFCLANPGALAAVVCTEICSAAMVSDDAPDLVVSNALFGDGSAAVLLQSGGGKGPALVDTASLVVPAWREGLRFRSEKGHLRNVLSPEVPMRAARATRTLLQKLLHRQGLQSRHKPVDSPPRRSPSA